MENLKDWLGLGVEPKDLTVVNVMLRALVIFVASIVMIRIGDKRFLSRKSALDAVVGFILASVMARAVNGSGSLVPTICAGFLIVLLHRFLSDLATHAHWLGQLLKGKSDLIIENGVVNRKVMAKNNISERDLMEDLRSNGGVSSVEEVRLAYIERSGEISVVKK